MNIYCVILHIRYKYLYCAKKHNMKRVTKVSTKIITDSESGEVLETEQSTTSILPREPDFVKLYVKDIGRMFDLTKSDDKVLFCITKHMTFSNLVFLVMPVKKMIMAELNMPLNTLNDSIRNLSNSGIMQRQAHGVYLINPNLFAKGKWEDIVKIRMAIEYSATGKKITSIEVENKHIEISEITEMPTTSKPIDDPRQRNLLDAIAEAESVK